MTIEQAPPVERVFSEASHFLQLVVDAADFFTVTLPGKQYITSGEAVHDCEQVVVTVTELTSGLPGQPVQVIENCPLTWTMVAMVDIVRCAPKPNTKGIVSSNALTEAAKTQSGDTTILMDAAQRRVDERLGGVGGFISYLAPEGGFMVTRLVLQVTVN